MRGLARLVSFFLAIPNGERFLCFCYRTIKTVSIQHTVEFSYLCNFFFGHSSNRGPEVNKHKQFYLFIKFLSKTRIFVTGNFKILKTFNNGSLGSRIDEERSEMRYVMVQIGRASCRERVLRLV